MRAALQEAERPVHGTVNAFGYCVGGGLGVELSVVGMDAGSVRELWIETQGAQHQLIELLVVAQPAVRNDGTFVHSIRYAELARNEVRRWNVSLRLSASGYRHLTIERPHADFRCTVVRATSGALYVGGEGSERPVHVTTKADTFHLTHCSLGRRAISQEEFTSARAALRAGYRPCQICLPPA